MTDSMSEVVERLAKAIVKESRKPSVGLSNPQALIRAALTELTAMGLVVVPKWPTPEMIEVGIEARWQSAMRNPDGIREIWTAMLTASKVQP